MAREAGCPAVAVLMAATAAECRERNALRTGHRRVSAERMERMLAAFEPVTASEGFARVYSGSNTSMSEILSGQEVLIA